MILKIDRFIFYQSNVAFHMYRESVYDPWECIGVCVSCDGEAACKYVPEYRYMAKAFNDAARDAGSLCGTFDFMQKWHERHQDLNSPVTKVIKYYRDETNVDNLINHLGKVYIGPLNTGKCGMISIMLKSREAYFPVVFNKRRKDRKEIVAALRKAGYEV